MAEKRRRQVRLKVWGRNRPWAAVDLGPSRRRSRSSSEGCWSNRLGAPEGGRGQGPPASWVGPRSTGLHGGTGVRNQLRLGLAGKSKKRHVQDARALGHVVRAPEYASRVNWERSWELCRGRRGGIKGQEADDLPPIRAWRRG